ncbi:hypothetical protein CDD83_7982 [Cordyceps sp. RAO-2017]|nr:hypothetical protein CDD83_7982 [Cordyceps sp. RAO-2017]
MRLTWLTLESPPSLRPSRSLSSRATWRANLDAPRHSHSSIPSDVPDKSTSRQSKHRATARLLRRVKRPRQMLYRTYIHTYIHTQAFLRLRPLDLGSPAPCMYVHTYVPPYAAALSRVEDKRTRGKYEKQESSQQQQPTRPGLESSAPGRSRPSTRGQARPPLPNDDEACRLRFPACKACSSNLVTSTWPSACLMKHAQRRILCESRSTTAGPCHVRPPPVSGSRPHPPLHRPSMIVWRAEHDVPKKRQHPPPPLPRPGPHRQGDTGGELSWPGNETAGPSTRISASPGPVACLAPDGRSLTWRAVHGRRRRLA